MATEFLVRGAREYGEPGVFMSFEESQLDLIANSATLGFGLADLIEKKMIVIDQVVVDKNEIIETGEFDLEGIFVRLNYAIESIGAKRVVLDTLEALFAGLTNEGILRAELRRLFRWLKQKEMTALITGERGKDGLTRYGIEEYVSDCVIFLDHRVTEQVSTRRLRIVKYRGSIHGTNEYPFIIGETGISVLPITSLKLEYGVSSDRVSMGIHGLDDMLRGGVFKGTSVLVSGVSGTGKTSFVMELVDAACRRGEKCLVFAFEEAERQIIRNMSSIGLNLDQWVKSGSLRIQSERPFFTGLEAHLIAIHKAVNDVKPDIVVLDPISNLNAVGSLFEVKSMLTRVVDYLKMNNITAVMTALMEEKGELEMGTMGISSLIDTWISLGKSFDPEEGYYNTVSIVKSRGMEHSKKMHRFTFTESGVEIEDTK